jgi:hypothetical protein
VTCSFGQVQIFRQNDVLSTAAALLQLDGSGAAKGFSQTLTLSTLRKPYELSLEFLTGAWQNRQVQPASWFVPDAAMSPGSARRGQQEDAYCYVQNKTDVQLHGANGSKPDAVDTLKSDSRLLVAPAETVTKLLSRGRVVPYLALLTELQMSCER